MDSTTQKYSGRKCQLKAALALALCVTATSLPLSAAISPTADMAEQHAHSLKDGELVMRLKSQNKRLTIEVEGLDAEHIARVRLGAIALPLTLNASQTGDAMTLELDDDETIRWSVPIALLRNEPPSVLDFVIVLTDGSEMSQPVFMDLADANSADEQSTSATGNQSKAASQCPWLTVQAPSSNSVSCSFATKKCANPDKQHTGIDYSGKGSNVVRAAANGQVVAIEYRWGKKGEASDHGMGTSVILKHHTSSCSAIYSSYSHLDSLQGDAKKLNANVSRGTTIGIVGGSGYGLPNYWGSHLHFEMKSAPVTGNPGAGKGCKTTNSCWGYTVDDPKKYGYLNPSDWFGK